MSGGTSIRKTALAPGLRGILVLCGAKLASSLRLLLQRLLLLSIGVSNLYLKFFAAGCDRMVIERLDDIFARVTGVKAECMVSDIGDGEPREYTDRAKPTPRPWPFLSRRIRDEHTLYGSKSFASSCSFIDFGRFDT